MFRKYEMSMKKESVHRCLMNNMAVIDLLYQLYTPTNYDRNDPNRASTINFLRDIGTAYVSYVNEEATISFDRTHEDQEEMNLQRALKELNELNYD